MRASKRIAEKEEEQAAVDLANPTPIIAIWYLKWTTCSPGIAPAYRLQQLVIMGFTSIKCGGKRVRKKNVLPQSTPISRCTYVRVRWYIVTIYSFL